MLLRLSLNFAAHLVARIAVGALVVVAAHSLRTREDESVSSAQDLTSGTAQNSVDHDR